MIINLSRHKLPTIEALESAGYLYRKDKKDFIREDHKEGRFHIMRQDKLLILHYDIYVEWRHVTFNLPEHTKKESRRIKKFIQNYKKQKRDEKDIPRTSEA